MKRVRLQEIVSYINAMGYASFAELYKEFGVSPATMRRNLTELDEKGLIKRVRGGARSIISLDSFDTSITNRINMHVNEKKEIAKFAASLIKDGDIIILDASTSALTLAETLAETDYKITVITNLIPTINIFKEKPNIELYILGGQFKDKYESTLGLFSEKMLKEIKVDLYFFSCDSIDIKAGILNTHFDTIPLKQISLENSNKKIVLADHSKFESKSFLHVCDINEVDMIITDKGIDESIYNSFIEKNINVIKA